MEKRIRFSDCDIYIKVAIIGMYVFTALVVINLLLNLIRIFHI